MLAVKPASGAVALFVCAAGVVLGLCGGAPARADGIEPAPAAPAACASPRDFVLTDCQLSWQGIRVYGTIDAGAGWQSHGAPLNPEYPPGGSYLIQKMNRSPMWNYAPSPLTQSNIGIKGVEPVGSTLSVIFDLETAFSTYSFRLANGPGSQARNIGVPLNRQTTNGDASKEGQWFNNQGYLGLSSDRYGTLTAFWQNSLTLDALAGYDPMGGSYAFSPIGYHGDACGPGDTELCKGTSLKYRLNLRGLRLGVLWQFGDYRLGDGAKGTYEAQLGTDIPNLAKGTLSVDGLFSYARDAVSTGIVSGGAGLNGDGAPIPPYLPQTLAATLSDITGAMALASYSRGPVKWYGGYEWVQYAPPSDPTDGFVDIAGTPIGLIYNNGTEVNNTAFSAGAGFKDRIEQIVWTGFGYNISPKIVAKVAYYRLFQNNYFRSGPNSNCDTAAHGQCAGALQAVSGLLDWQFLAKWDAYAGCMYSQVSGGMANGYLKHNNVDPTVGLRLRF